MAVETRPEPARTATRTEALPTVLAIVVTHRGRRWLRDCLVSLNSQTYPLLDVLVVDDASPDWRESPPLRRIAKRHLKRRRWGFLRTPRPLGFGGAVNWALSRVKTDADYLLFVHDDVVLEAGAVARLVARLHADDQTAVAGPKVVSWDDPERLEEIGLAADRFGYPYKGLEEGEIDLGQHDVASEVFFVSSTCMLVRHDVFRDLRGFDARMRAFSEDLDLCWRARVAGHGVRVEPTAVARHAIALAKGHRSSPFVPIRYFIRRNRLRTVMKNASGTRLLALIPTFVLLSFVEMLGFIVLRQPREIVNLARALAWNFVVLPQTLSERARVQRVRRIPDRRLRLYTVRQTTRLRFYLAHQADRFQEAWGRRADLLARSATGARLLGTRIKGWPLTIGVVTLIAVLLAFRHLLWGPPATVGELLPYPERATGLLRAFLSPWQATGLGHPGPAPPALALLGGIPLLTFGAAGAAQKLLVLGLGAVAFVGAYKLVGDVVDKWGRVAAGLAYTLGPVGYAGLREGRLGALVFGAAAPFVLLGILRLTGWARPTGWIRSRAVARLALGSAISAAFVPGALILYVIVAVVLAAARKYVEHGADAERGLAGALVGVGIGWVLLLPWSLTWFSTGGAFDRLWSNDTWELFAKGFENEGALSVLLGQTPDAPVLFGLALPLLGVVAGALGEGQRRTYALALWSTIVLIAVLNSLMGSGLLRPLTASPIESGVLSAAAFAGLVGLGVGAFRLDLPRRGLGLVHAISLSAVALAGFLIAAGIIPAMLGGEWGPGRAVAKDVPLTIDQIRSVFLSEVQESGQFRTLWVGQKWASPSPTLARPVETHFVSGPRGQVLTDLFERETEESEAPFEAVLESIEEGTTDRGGALLGAFNIRFVVVDPEHAGDWLRQRDLAVFRSEAEYLVFENQNSLPRAALYPELPRFVRAITEGKEELTAGVLGARHGVADQRSASSYVVEKTSGPGVVFLAESADGDWKATLEGSELERSVGGWGNAFIAPSHLEGALVISYGPSSTWFLWFIAIALAWVVVLGAAVTRRAPGVARAAE